MIILGVDPGSTSGWSAVLTHPDRVEFLEAGTISCGTGALGQRVRHLHEEMQKVLDMVQPDVVAIEQLHVRIVNPKTALVLAQLRGGLIQAIAEYGLNEVDVIPSEWKLAVAGNGNAKKSEVRDVIVHELGADIKGLRMDAADATGIALWMYLTMQQQGRLEAA